MIADVARQLGDVVPVNVDPVATYPCGSQVEWRWENCKVAVYVDRMAMSLADIPALAACIEVDPQHMLPSTLTCRVATVAAYLSTVRHGHHLVADGDRHYAVPRVSFRAVVCGTQFVVVAAVDRANWTEIVVRAIVFVCLLSSASGDQCD